MLHVSLSIPQRARTGVEAYVSHLTMLRDCGQCRILGRREHQILRLDTTPRTSSARFPRQFPKKRETRTALVSLTLLLWSRNNIVKAAWRKMKITLNRKTERPARGLEL